MDTITLIKENGLRSWMFDVCEAYYMFVSYAPIYAVMNRIHSKKIEKFIGTQLDHVKFRPRPSLQLPIHLSHVGAIIYAGLLEKHATTADMESFWDEWHTYDQTGE